MHELSICQGLIRELERVASEHRAMAVERVVLSVGPLSGVEGALLERAFSVARIGTLAEGAELEVQTGPVRVSCRVCGEESEAEPHRLLCGHCGGWQTNLVAGDELLLKQVELSDASARAGDHQGMR